MIAYIFDLDDTLYPEMEFVRSGFGAVSDYLASNSGHNSEIIYNKILAIHALHGRGKIFDSLMAELFPSSDRIFVDMCVYLYRTHKPLIHMDPEALECLTILRRKSKKIGLITDGMASVQKRKIEALKIEDHLDVSICTDELGKDNWKPSIIPYLLASRFIGVEPSDCVYIGDNLTKDFIGAKKLGMGTVYLSKYSPSNQIDFPPENRADLQINTLLDLNGLYE